jgi:hypothetical protein
MGSPIHPPSRCSQRRPRWAPWIRGRSGEIGVGEGEGGTMDRAGDGCGDGGRRGPRGSGFPGGDGVGLDGAGVGWFGWRGTMDFHARGWPGRGARRGWTGAARRKGNAGAVCGGGGVDARWAELRTHKAEHGL